MYVLLRPLLFCCAALWSDLDGEGAETFVLVLIVIATVLLFALLSGFIVVKVTRPTYGNLPTYLPDVMCCNAL